LADDATGIPIRLRVVEGDLGADAVLVAFKHQKHTLAWLDGVIPLMAPPSSKQQTRHAEHGDREVRREGIRLSNQGELVGRQLVLAPHESDALKGELSRLELPDDVVGDAGLKHAVSLSLKTFALYEHH